MPKWTPVEWGDATLRLLARSKSNCELCGKQLHGRAERHHRKRRREGGDRLSNLLLIHVECHHKTTRHPAWARELGYIVSVHVADPVQTPVWYQRRRWVLLDDDGGLQDCPAPGGPFGVTPSDTIGLHVHPERD